MNLQGETPSLKCVRNAVARVHEQRDALVPKCAYGNCGWLKDLTEKEEKSVVDFVKKRRHKRFCTSAYIRQHLRLSVSPRTIQRTLNRHQFHWRPVPKKIPLTGKELLKRKAFVE